jgi:hypothetical protein
MKRYALGIATAALALAACASGGASSTADGVRQFERNVGTGSASDVVDRSLKVLRLHQFQIEQQEAPPNIYIQTRWRDRAPDDAEQMRGVTATQARVIVRANQRSSTHPTGGAVYSVNVSVEGREQLQGSTSWQDATSSEQFAKWAERIVNDFKTELEIGVRRF